MKEIEKISISGIAFTLETDAMEMLNNYLESLRNYYKNVAGNEEIVSDVEERIAELLIERGAKDRVVDNSDIQYVIAILGTPEELRDADGVKSGQENMAKGRAEQTDGNVKKGLYRDMQNKVLGGVCSGLAKYFDISPVPLRIAFFVAVVLGCGTFIIGHTISSLLLISYIILWIAVPPAKTVAQRCSMDGIDPGLDGIRDYKSKTVNKMDNSGNSLLHIFGRTICFAVGVFMLVMGISGLISGLVLLFGIEIFTGLSAYNFADFILPGMGLVFFKIALMGVWFIPCIAFLYVGSMLCFNFKSPKWRPGLIMFILWIVSVVAAVSIGLSKVSPFINHYEQDYCTYLGKQYDTLYVEFKTPQLSGSSKMYMKDNIYGDVNLYYVDKNQDGGMIAYYPFFEIKRDKYHNSNVALEGEGYLPYIEAENEFFYGASLADVAWGQGENDMFVIRDSLITVCPKILSKEKPFDGKLTKLKLVVPYNTVVIMREPKVVEFVSHRYDD